MITMNRCKLALILTVMFVLAACGQQASRDFDLTIDGGVITITTVSLPRTLIAKGTCGESLPDELTLNSAGIISGTPIKAGTVKLTITAKDSSRNTNVNEGLYKNSDGTPVTLEAIGGVPPYVWSISSGSLPEGITLAPDTGTLSGEPTGLGVFQFDTKVTDSQASQDSATLSIDVFGMATLSLPGGKVGEPYNFSLVAVGGESPYIWALRVCP